MRRVLAVVLWFAIVASGKDLEKVPHPDYVPDEKTAVRIAEAVLIGQFGDERVNAQLPLSAMSTSKDSWLVQGSIKDKEGRTQVGGSLAVWVDKHTGCVSVIEHMK